MEQTERQEKVCVEALTVRRTADARALYEALGRDGLWALDHEQFPLDVLAGGPRALGAFGPDGALLAVCALVEPASVLPQARAMAAGLRGLPGPALLGLPAAFLPGEDGLRGLAALGGRLAAGGCAAALAVKPCVAGAGAAPLGALLDAGLILCRVRPLLSLRPHYLFLPPDTGAVQNGGKERIMIPYDDTRALGRRLEAGCRGVGHLMYQGGAQVLLTRGEEEHAADRDTG